jgi:hypothetical protein
MTRKIKKTNNFLDDGGCRMTETIVPSMQRRLIDPKSLSCKRCWQRIKALVTPSFKKKSPGDSILYQEKIWIKLKEDIIIRDKMVNRNQTLFGMWYMKDLFEFKITGRNSSFTNITNSSFTNITNTHTCAISSVDLFITVVLLSEGKLL